VSKRPLFSTYNQGENRVTASIVAVFTHLDLTTLEELFTALLEESSLELMRFEVVRPQGAGRVPDASIASSFRYLFEVKTSYESLSEAQLRGHLGHLDASHRDERLFALTPDDAEPPILSAIADDRLRWFSFRDLDRAIAALVARDETADGERLLLKELRTLFSQEGLLGREDTVVVAARHAYDFYLRRSAYVCQAGRAFRKDLRRLAFYRARRIECEIPAILERRDNVPFTHEEVARLRATATGADTELARLIADSLDAGDHLEGVTYQVFLLSPPDSSETHRLQSPIAHHGDGRGSAFTMGQRYVFFEHLERGPETTAELAAPAEA